jgi:photosystem II stability/assembly factor-like uncharacterized protein
MKTSNRQSTVFLFFVICFLTACQAAPSDPWEIVAEYNVHHSVMTAGFLNESYGITGGVVGYMYHTTDGGQSWVEDVNSSDCRYGMEILDEGHAWTCGGMTHVRRSDDGGLTWQEAASFGLVRDGPCRLMSFVDQQNGWLASAHHMGVTADGAASWKLMDEPEGTDAQHIVGIGLYAPNHGYMMNESGTFYHTADDGAHWSLVPSLKPEGWEFPRSVYAVVTMRFQDADHGIVVMHLKKDTEERVMAFHTTDGGQTWISEQVPVKPGPLYLSQDGRLLTVITGPNMMTVLRYTGQ